jgi:hypothetical protein
MNSDDGIPLKNPATALRLNKRWGPPRFGLPRSWRIIPEIDKDQQLIALVQTLSGRILLFICFAILLHALGGNLSVALLAAACAYASRYRWHLIPLATLFLLYQNGFWIDVDVVARVAAQEGIENQFNQPLLLYSVLAFFILICSCTIQFWGRLRAIRIFRRSTLCLILSFLTLVVIAQSPFLRGVSRVWLWSFLATFSTYFWFLAYALADVAAGDPSPFWQRLGLFHPFWGSTLTPFGKGAAYLKRFEAKTPGELAVTQLKGLKLIIWVGLLSCCLHGFVLSAHDYLLIPSYDEAFAHSLSGMPYPWYLGWASLISSFFEDLLEISVWGGVIVSSARMAGFRLLRNTYKPLEALTIADFWNRFYFYFKELLVDHFFYPAFFRCFRSHRKFRIFFATFMAACVGNLIYHFIRDIHLIADMGCSRALIGEETHAFYTVALALGIAFSQMRPLTVEPSRGWLRGRLLPRIRVALFFCVLHIFDAPLDRTHSIWQHSRFLLHLFGLDIWN